MNKSRLPAMQWTNLQKVQNYMAIKTIRRITDASLGTCVEFLDEGMGKETAS